MVVLIVLISTIGKVVSHRSPRVERPAKAPQLEKGEAAGMRETLDNLSGRVVRLEEERDFYKELLDAPARQKGLPSPEARGDDSQTTGSS